MIGVPYIHKDKLIMCINKKCSFYINDECLYEGGQCIYIEESVSILNKCKEEIKWAQDNIDEMNASGSYYDDDKIWLPCWLKAHQEMLKLITNS